MPNPTAVSDLGPLPEWNLGDLYPGPDSQAFRDDLDRADREAQSFAEDFRGKLATLAASPDASEKLGARGRPL